MRRIQNSDNYDNVTGYDEALDASEEFISNHPNFVQEFVQYRGDALTSDREIAAFAFALSSYGAIRFVDAVES